MVNSTRLNLRKRMTELSKPLYICVFKGRHIGLPLHFVPLCLFLLLTTCYAGVYMEMWESINDEIPVITYHSYSNDQWKIEDTKGLATIVDFKKGTLTVIYEKENIYAVEDLNNLMKRMQAASEKLLTEQEKEQQTPGN